MSGIGGAGSVREFHSLIEGSNSTREYNVKISNNESVSSTKTCVTDARNTTRCAETFSSTTIGTAATNLPIVQEENQQPAVEQNAPIVQPQPAVGKAVSNNFVAAKLGAAAAVVFVGGIMLSMHISPPASKDLVIPLASKIQTTIGAGVLGGLMGGMMDIVTSGK